MSGIIVEGVTGVGKTSTLKALTQRFSFELFDEDATFDDFMGELGHDADVARRNALGRMNGILDQVEATRPKRWLLERLHPSHFALDVVWEAYQSIDDRCADLQCGIVLLSIPDAAISSRSLYRAEYAGRDWQGFVGLYGSEEKALGAIGQSQRLRFDALKRSKMKHLVIDTSEKAWDQYAVRIAEFAGWA